MSFLRNLAVAWTRLRRRVPRPRAAGHRNWMLVRGFLALAAVAIVYAAIWLDRPSVAWAASLPTELAIFFGFITRYGQSDWMLISTAIAVVVLLAADWSLVKRSMAAAWAEIGVLVYFFFLAVAGAGLTNNLVKWIIGRSRPIAFDTDGPFRFTPFSFDYAHVSFPSGHATNVAAAASVVALVAPRAAVPVVVGAALIAISRVAVGAHYPSDVVAGICIGVTFTVTLAYVFADARCGFRTTAGGGLRPQTVAVRGVIKRGGVKGLARGLWEALARTGRREAAGLSR